MVVRCLDCMVNSKTKMEKETSFQDIGKKFLNDLIDQERYEDAARLCKKIFGQNKDLWEQEAYRFAGIHQLKVGVQWCFVPL